MMKKLVALLLLPSILTGCTDTKKESSFVLPESGTRVAAGTAFSAKIAFGDTPDSIVYRIDSARVFSKADTAAVQLSSAGLTMGSHLLTAAIYRSGKAEEITSNIVVVPDKAPERWSYDVVNTFPHDTASFTEGLEFHDGILYESDGMENESSLRTADLRTGKVLKKTDLAPRFFGEGMTIVGDKIIQLTYRTRESFIYDKKTLQKTGEFTRNAGAEGWGLFFDGQKLLMTDGSNTIFLLDPKTYQQTGAIEVYDQNGPVKNLNELEVINGKIYANIYLTDSIAVIDPASGAVEALIDLGKLYPQKDSTEFELNGIAWDKADRRLFVTGKKWKKLFEIRVKKED